ncbi:hypothetical protein [Marinomonas ostreistagni]|uniref:hypothetical protein n=1 Tax=Marinomonas ostreistagni TaxID=359209 RepID=UPI00194E48F6|nr:hypothetical protein [Marinomonas ostreistagni]MBM6551154.1 hypothetical protein [Marinomonas ostreistagni]
MFQFKGHRQYIHGTDFYQHTLNAAQAQREDVVFIRSMAFRSYAEFQCEFSLTPPTQDATIPCSGKLALADGSTIPFWWQETNDAVTSRYEYDEQAVVQGFQITDQSIRLATPHLQYYSLIETIVALTKCLHYALDSEVDGKWVFAQLNLDQALPITTEDIEISVQNWIPKRFSVSDIHCAGVKVGKIRFIVG